MHSYCVMSADSPLGQLLDSHSDDIRMKKKVLSGQSSYPMANGSSCFKKKQLQPSLISLYNIRNTCRVGTTCSITFTPAAG